MITKTNTVTPAQALLRAHEERDELIEALGSTESFGRIDDILGACETLSELGFSDFSGGDTPEMRQQMIAKLSSFDGFVLAKEDLAGKVTALGNTLSLGASAYMLFVLGILRKMPSHNAGRIATGTALAGAVFRIVGSVIAFKTRVRSIHETQKYLEILESDMKTLDKIYALPLTGNHLGDLRRLEESVEQSAQKFVAVSNGGWSEFTRSGWTESAYKDFLTNAAKLAETIEKKYVPAQKSFDEKVKHAITQTSDKGEIEYLHDLVYTTEDLIDGINYVFKNMIKDLRNMSRYIKVVEE